MILEASHESELVNISVKRKDGYIYEVISGLIVAIYMVLEDQINDLQPETEQNDLNNQWKNDQFYDL